MIEKKVSLEELVLYGPFRFYDTNKQIANACLYDKISSKYRLGYVIETRDNTLKESYLFTCDTNSRFTIPIRNLKQIKEWCYQQKIRL